MPREGRRRAHLLCPPLRPRQLKLPALQPPLRPVASGADGACEELSRQAARMVAEGVDGVVGFLRPSSPASPPIPSRRRPSPAATTATSPLLSTSRCRSSLELSLVFSLAFIPFPHLFFRLLTRKENKGIVTLPWQRRGRGIRRTEVRRWGWGPPMRRHTDSSHYSLESPCHRVLFLHPQRSACVLGWSVLLAGLLMVLTFYCWVDD